jgi:hypothetical protein
MPGGGDARIGDDEDSLRGQCRDQLTDLRHDSRTE